MEETRFEKIMAAYCDKAIRQAKLFEKNLNNTDDSIQRIEEILEIYYNEWNTTDKFKKIIRKIVKKEKPSDNQIRVMSVAWGIYIGENIRRKLGSRCSWTLENHQDGPKALLIVCEDMRIDPIEQVYKRLTLGPEENVATFYRRIYYR